MIIEAPVQMVAGLIGEITGCGFGLIATVTPVLVAVQPLAFVTVTE
jgi:uncharacterized membrane protein YfcA